MVTGEGRPPEDCTRIKPAVPAKTMVPSRLHVPPPPGGASQMVCGGPPEGATFFSLLSAKKPMDCPSGDQNGNSAPSVRSSRCGLNEPSGRIQRNDFPPGEAAANQ